MSTIVERLESVIKELDGKATLAGRSDSGREFALSKTAAEEALMRYTRGRAFEEGVQKNYDFDKGGN